MDLLELLEEQEHGPLPCPHRFVSAKRGAAYRHDTDPESPYFEEWVHADPSCLRSSFPGQYKDPLPTEGWDPDLQKDVPINA